jgi:hypothetical protein
MKHVIIHDNVIEERDTPDNSRALYQNTSLDHVNVLGGRMNVRPQWPSLWPSSPEVDYSKCESHGVDNCWRCFPSPLGSPARPY